MTDQGPDLAAELRALRGRLADTDEIARESAGLLSEALPKMLGLEEDMATLRGTVAALVADAENTPAEGPAITEAKAQLGLRPEPPTPWCWPLFDRDEAAAAWDALARWVGQVLVPSCELTRGQLLDCWPHHPRLVAELSALRHGYLEAHARGAAAHKAADWHGRQLPNLLGTVEVVAKPNRLREGCGPGFHLDGQPSEDGYMTAAREAEPLTLELWRDALQEAMAADLARR